MERTCDLIILSCEETLTKVQFAQLRKDIKNSGMGGKTVVIEGLKIDYVTFNETSIPRETRSLFAF